MPLSSCCAVPTALPGPSNFLTPRRLRKDGLTGCGPATPKEAGRYTGGRGRPWAGLRTPYVLWATMNGRLATKSRPVARIARPSPDHLRRRWKLKLIRGASSGPKAKTSLCPSSRKACQRRQCHSWRSCMRASALSPLKLRWGSTSITRGYCCGSRLVSCWLCCSCSICARCLGCGQQPLRSCSSLSFLKPRVACAQLGSLRPLCASG